jgi:hypothetical protein
VTRINVGVDPSELNTKMLIAEHREIKRIPNNIRTGKAIIKDIPTKFTLGKGHVKFFYDKIGYLQNRYKQLYQECINRGFNVTDYSESFYGIPESLMNDYEYSIEDRCIILDRINERLVNIK